MQPLTALSIIPALMTAGLGWRRRPAGFYDGISPAEFRVFIHLV